MTKTGSGPGSENTVMERLLDGTMDVRFLWRFKVAVGLCFHFIPLTISVQYKLWWFSQYLIVSSILLLLPPSYFQIFSTVWGSESNWRLICLFAAHPSAWRTCHDTHTFLPSCLAPVGGRRLTCRNLRAKTSSECSGKSKRWASPSTQERFIQDFQAYL